MKFDIRANDEVLVKLDVNLSVLAKLMQGGTSLNALTAASNSVSKSTKAAKEQLEELLARVDPKSAQFLRKIAASDDGTITWGEMRTIFGIEDKDDWPAFSNSYGKGITRAFRHILNNRSARLVWWDDHNWDQEEWDANEVYIDGEALQALREATGVASS